MLYRSILFLVPVMACAATPGPKISTFTQSGPIKLVSGQIVTGKQITSTSGPCIYGSGVSNVQIYDNKIGPCGRDPDGNGIELAGSGSNITVRNNQIEDVASGFYAVGVSGNNIVIKDNIFRNARGPFTNGRGQYVQFNNVRGAGHKILCNVGEQTPIDKAEKEDSISMFASSGTADSPIEIAYNKIRGGSSYNGAGIMTGDNGGEWVHVHHNNVIQTGGLGLGISGGRNIVITDNKVYSPQTRFSNVGAAVFSYQGASCSGNTFARNQITWKCGNASYCGSPGADNHFWDSSECGAVSGNGTNVLGASLDPTLMWNESFPACENSSTPAPTPTPTPTQTSMTTPPPASAPTPTSPPNSTSCELPWGGKVASGSSVTAFQDSRVVRPNRCKYESRTCRSGSLSGSYQYQSCRRTRS